MRFRRCHPPTRVPISARAMGAATRRIILSPCGGGLRSVTIRMAESARDLSGWKPPMGLGTPALPCSKASGLRSPLLSPEPGDTSKAMTATRLTAPPSCMVRKSATVGGFLPLARQPLNALRTAPFDNTESALSGRARHVEGRHGWGQPLQVECANFFESHHLLDRNNDALIDENLSILGPIAV